MNKFFPRLLFLTGTLLAVSSSIFAQYGNEWIDFSQDYYRVSVASDGAFRLTYSDLQAAGFPVNFVDPRRVKLYHRGVEQAIIVQGQADAQLDPGDYIEFYGQKNDGTNDQKLYTSASLQPHPYYNLYSDTSAYFLTWSLGAVTGKRMEIFSEVNVGGIPKDSYHYNQRLDVYANEYSTGNTVNGVLQYSQFDQGEGWTGSTICIGNSGCTGQQDYVLSNLTNGVQPAGNPQFEILLVGRDALSHLAEVYVGPNTGSLRLLATQSFVNYETPKITLPLNWSDISAGGQLAVRVKALGVGGVRDRLSVSYIKINYPQDFNMAAQATKWFRLETNPTPPNKSYIEITNPPSGFSLWDVTDPDNVVSIGTSLNAGVQTAVIPNANTQRVLFAKNNFTTPVIKQVTFRQINPANVNYIIISNRALMKPALGYSDPVRAYGGYRSTAEGGGYDTLVMPMEVLYDQFNHGEKSSLAIYQFMKYMVDNGDPKYLFLIGKGLNVSQGTFRKSVFAPNDLRDLVPSSGMPGSDMAFTAGLSGTTYEPAVPTGRITASTPAQVASYLNKTMELEAEPFDMLWRKEVLHLSGGIQPFEITAFKQYMETFEEIAAGPYYGGTVTTIAKHEPNPVELINVSGEVNKGVNLITFFGHSSPNTIDIDIGFATDPVLGYNNPGKYPAFLINGCNAGVFFSNSTVFGEDWILAANKGARNFIAHSSFGFVSTLRAYTQLFYEVGYSDSTFIRKGIGDIQKEVGRRYLEVNSTDISSVTQVQQMVLLGDPAVKLFGALKPDYEIDNNSLYLESFDDKPVTALSDSFAIKIISKNFGSVSKANIGVSVERTFNDNSTIFYDSIFESPRSLDTLTFIIRKDEGSNGFGNNRFLITLDYQNKIDELNEANNQGTLELFIPLSGTKNLFPLNYGIVNQPSVTLTWQNTDLLSGMREYEVEIDTLPTFTSSYLKKQTVSGKVLMRLPITILAQDSLVYYWRTKLKAPEPGENESWSESSFSFINNSNDGWAQIHFPQFSENSTIGLVKDPAIRKLKFEETSATIYINNFGSNYPSPPATSFKINDVEYNLATQFQPCRNNTINFVALDKTTLVPYAGIPFIFQDPRTCGREPQVINSFTLAEMETGAGDDILQYIDNINPSDSVVIFSIGNANYGSWTANVITKLGELGLGAGQIAALQAGEPVVIFGKKGAGASTAKIKTSGGSPANQQELQVGETLTGKYTSGSMNSVLIGPAAEWQKFTVFTREKEAADDYNFDLVGVDLDGKENVLFTGVTTTTDLSGVDANEVPLLKIILHTTDDLNQSPIQLHQWIVHYTPVAEGILLFKGTPDPVFLSEGASWKVDYSFVNISSKSFTDSLGVNFETFNKYLRAADKKTMRIKAPAPGDSTQFSFAIETNNKVGPNDVNVFVNPKILPEQYYENNVLELHDYLNVEGDKIIPVLDVTVDGRYLLDGDFVSPNPDIRARVWDENRFVLKKDTIGIRLLLKSPCESGDCNFKVIHFSRSDVTWTPASETTDFLAEFRPANLGAGNYTLRVEAKDGSGNGNDAPYEVQFVVNPDTSLQFFSPFPNPSTGNVFFGFSLSGSVRPDLYSVQVFSLDGREVHYFSVNGNVFHIGSNQFTWDGRDSSGNLQRAGMYLYRESLSANGKVETRNGKIVLLR